MNACADTNLSSSHIINSIQGSVMFMQSHFQGWSFWHLYWRILDHLGVDIVKSVKVFQLHKLTIDCHAGRGDGSRISHLKLSYQILHEISSSLVPGVLDFHKCPLLCGVMRPNHLFFPRLHRSNIIGTPLGAVFLESFTNSDNLSQMKPWSLKRKRDMSKISQSITHKHCSCFEKWITGFSARF